MKIGFIGLGIMGRPMVKKLVGAGHELFVYDIIRKNMLESGGTPCASIREAVKDVMLIITMLPDSPQVRDVMLGEGSVLESAQSGALVVDMSSIAPMVSVEVGKALSAKGIRFIDAPVSGGEPKAIDGTLSIMAGGGEDDFREAEPVLRCMGSSVVRVGELGSGNTVKLANQMIVALNIAAVSEAFVMASKAGVDPKLLYSAISGGLAGSTVMNAKAPMIMEGTFAPGFKIDLHIKDLNNAMDMARAVETPLFLTPQVLQILKALSLDGEGGSDHSAIVKFYEGISKCRVKDHVT